MLRQFRDSRVYRRAESLKRRAAAISSSGTRSTLTTTTTTTTATAATSSGGSSDSSSAGGSGGRGNGTAGLASTDTGTGINPMQVFSTKVDIGSAELAVEGIAGTAGRLEGRLAPGGRPHYGGGGGMSPRLSLQQRILQWQDEEEEGNETTAATASAGACFVLKLLAPEGQDGFRMASLGQLQSLSQLAPEGQERRRHGQQLGVLDANGRAWSAHTVHDLFWWSGAGAGARAGAGGKAEVDATTAQPGAVELHPVSVLAHAAARAAALAEDTRSDLGYPERKHAASSSSSSSPHPNSNSSKFRVQAGLSAGGYLYDYSAAEVQVEERYSYGERGGPAPHRDAIITLKPLKPYTPYAN